MDKVQSQLIQQQHSASNSHQHQQPIPNHQSLTAQHQHSSPNQSKSGQGSPAPKPHANTNGQTMSNPTKKSILDHQVHMYKSVIAAAANSHDRDKFTKRKQEVMSMVPSMQRYPWEQLKEIANKECDGVYASMTDSAAGAAVDGSNKDNGGDPSEKEAGKEHVDKKRKAPTDRKERSAKMINIESFPRAPQVWQALLLPEQDALKTHLRIQLQRSEWVQSVTTHCSKVVKSVEKQIEESKEGSSTLKDCITLDTLTASVSPMALEHIPSSIQGRLKRLLLHAMPQFSNHAFNKYYQPMNPNADSNPENHIALKSSENPTALLNPVQPRPSNSMEAPAVDKVDGKPKPTLVKDIQDNDDENEDVMLRDLDKSKIKAAFAADSKSKVKAEAKMEDEDERNDDMDSL